MRKDEKCYRNNWLAFYPHISKLSFRIRPASYFDSRWHIHCFLTAILATIGGITSLILGAPGIVYLFWTILFCIPWGECFIDLPIRSKWDEYEVPEYGFYFYGGTTMFDSFWICWNIKKKCIYMPWDWTWIRTSNLRKDGNWEHYKKGDRKDFYKDNWKEVIWNEKYPYTYVLKNGNIQKIQATIKVEEREWRWRWFKWLPLISRIEKTISVDFDGEVGERTGSWKGGTIDCWYLIKPGETPLDTLRRMEKDRKF